MVVISIADELKELERIRFEESVIVYKKCLKIYKMQVILLKINIPEKSCTSRYILWSFKIYFIANCESKLLDLIKAYHFNKRGKQQQRGKVTLN